VGDVVIVWEPTSGSITYNGDGFRDLDFATWPEEKWPITVRSKYDNPENCIIDCGDSGRAFWFHSGETSDSVVRGFTIRHGFASDASDGGARGGAVFVESGTNPTILNCSFEFNSCDSDTGTAAGGAVACHASNPIIANCIFAHNDRAGAGAGLYCDQFASPIITNCTFQFNSAGGPGGAVALAGSGPAMLLHSVFTQDSGSPGAAIYASAGEAHMINALLYDHHESSAATVLCSGAALYMTNCTVTGNSDPDGIYYALVCDSGKLVVRNSIVYGNLCGNLPGQIWEPVEGLIDVTYSDVEGGWTGVGSDNIQLDPEFVPGPWDGEYYLDQTLSPCKNAGHGTAQEAGLDAFTTDPNLSRDAGRVDMGFHYPIDCDNDRRPDIAQLMDGTGADCNRNGVLDSCDIADHTSQDNFAEVHNGIPDECEGWPADAAFTFDEDPVAGTLINLYRNANLGALERNEWAVPLKWLWAPDSGLGTIIRVDASAPTTQPVGRYHSCPGDVNGTPSRTAVDPDGNLWASNRSDGFAGQGSVVKIGLIVGGTRCDQTGAADADGEYLKPEPPFAYNTCVDRNGDGLIRTSSGLESILAWPGAHGSAETADDECVCQYWRVEANPTRHFCIDGNDNVWIGGPGVNGEESTVFQQLVAETGELLGPYSVLNGAGGYGGLIDGHDVIWSARRRGATWGDLLRWSPSGPPEDTFIIDDPAHHDTYGPGIDRDGNIWASQHTSGLVRKFSPAGEPQGVFATGSDAWDRGVAVTYTDGDVWVSGSDGVTRFHDDGTYVDFIDLGTGGYGLAVDQAGFVWVACKDAGSVKRIDPTSNQESGQVSLGPNAEPYAYSDMTGQVTLHTTGRGTWNVVYCPDAFHANQFGARWRSVTWNQEACVETPVPEGTSLVVQVRAADDQTALAGLPYRALESGVPFHGVVGRYLEIRVRMQGSRPGDDFATPVLCDLRADPWLVGDLNCDGHVNNFDITPFVKAISGTPPDYPEYYSLYPDCDRMLADVTGDGNANNFDITPFVYLVTHQ
jgi:streptogramin lyase